MMLLFNTKEKDHTSTAKKLHQQFCHPSAKRLIRLVETSGEKDQELNKSIEEVTNNCDYCKRYKKPSPKPVVSFPLATVFNDTVAMDLKVYTNNQIYLLHIIDHLTHFSAGAVIRSKSAEVIMREFFKSWVSIFGTPRRVLSDNGSEFANIKLDELTNKL